MITPKMEEQTKLITRKIEDSELEVEDKTQFIELINCSKEACNGYTQEEKVQAIAENQFTTSIILAKIMMMLKKGSAKTWKDVAIAALHSWHLVAIVGILSALLAFHPEIAEVIKSFAH